MGDPRTCDGCHAAEPRDEWDEEAECQWVCGECGLCDDCHEEDEESRVQRLDGLAEAAEYDMETR